MGERNNKAILGFTIASVPSESGVLACRCVKGLGSKNFKLQCGLCGKPLCVI